MSGNNILQIASFQFRGVSYETDPDTARLEGWAGFSNEPVGLKHNKRRSIQPKLMVPTPLVSIEAAKALSECCSEAITITTTEGQRIQLPGCTFASGGGLGDDMPSIEFNVSGTPLQI